MLIKLSIKILNEIVDREPDFHGFLFRTLGENEENHFANFHEGKSENPQNS